LDPPVPVPRDYGERRRKQRFGQTLRSGSQTPTQAPITEATVELDVSNAVFVLAPKVCPSEPKPPVHDRIEAKTDRPARQLDAEREVQILATHKCFVEAAREVERFPAHRHVGANHRSEVAIPLSPRTSLLRLPGVDTGRVELRVVEGTLLSNADASPVTQPPETTSSASQ